WTFSSGLRGSSGFLICGCGASPGRWPIEGRICRGARGLAATSARGCGADGLPTVRVGTRAAAKSGTLEPVSGGRMGGGPCVGLAGISTGSCSTVVGATAGDRGASLTGDSAVVTGGAATGGLLAGVNSATAADG